MVKQYDLTFAKSSIIFSYGNSVIDRRLFTKLERRFVNFKYVYHVFEYTDSSLNICKRSECLIHRPALSA